MRYALSTASKGKETHSSPKPSGSWPAHRWQGSTPEGEGGWGSGRGARALGPLGEGRAGRGTSQPSHDPGSIDDHHAVGGRQIQANATHSRGQQHAPRACTEGMLYFETRATKSGGRAAENGSPMHQAHLLPRGTANNSSVPET